MHIHILGICGTFMGGVAVLAKQLGHEVTGSDRKVYPPMSTQLEAQGITLFEGYDDPTHLDPAPDMVVVGNAMTRGMPIVEAVLNQNLRYTSGPQWLAEQVLAGCRVLAVSGTHGKTTTASMLAWILEEAGLHPGFLIGGVPQNFGVSARLHDQKHRLFVIEADEYDSAFFDKRSKFVHYRPHGLVINNLEYDHADIFPDLAAIQRQFHHLVRTVPSEGVIVAPQKAPAVDDVLAQGCWTIVERAGRYTQNDEPRWAAKAIQEDGSELAIYYDGDLTGHIRWNLIGEHNIQNALSAIAMAHHAGVSVEQACSALEKFKNVKRRLEVRGEAKGITVYDDFAHHPTAIELTLDGLRKKVGDARIITVLEPCSNTMRKGVHRDTLAPALQRADQVIIYQSQPFDWDVQTALAAVNPTVIEQPDTLVAHLVPQLQAGDHLLMMSNGSLGGAHDKILQALKDA